LVTTFRYLIVGIIDRLAISAESLIADEMEISSCKYPYETKKEFDLIELLQTTAIFLWRDWPRTMNLSSTSDHGFTFNGTCPHCNKEAAFPSVTGTFDEMTNTYSYSSGDRRIAALRCIACRQYILGIIELKEGSRSTWWAYKNHYPLGKPNDSVDEEVPENIREDFREALRCQWVAAYNSTAEACRRTVEASCINLGAPYDKVLQKMIDWLEEKQIITKGLKDVAHKIRLGGDRGAHPGEDPSEPPKYEPMIKIEKEHADAIVEYTRHFLEHVYVIPKRLPTFDFSKPKKK
jgi:hypothetical protein